MNWSVPNRSGQLTLPFGGFDVFEVEVDYPSMDRNPVAVVAFLTPNHKRHSSTQRAYAIHLAEFLLRGVWCC